MTRCFSLHLFRLRVRDNSWTGESFAVVVAFNLALTAHLFEFCKHKAGKRYASNFANATNWNWCNHTTTIGATLLAIIRNDEHRCAGALLVRSWAIRVCYREVIKAHGSAIQPENSISSLITVQLLQSFFQSVIHFAVGMQNEAKTNNWWRVNSQRAQTQQTKMLLRELQKDSNKLVEFYQLQITWVNLELTCRNPPTSVNKLFQLASINVRRLYDLPVFRLDGSGVCSLCLCAYCLSKCWWHILREAVVRAKIHD